MSLFTQISCARKAGNTSLWPGWFLCVLPGDAGESAVVEALSDAGVRDVISSSSSGVGYMAIPEVERVSVTDIDAVLVPGDPRRDPYLTGVSALFRSGDSSLIYLPADRSLEEYQSILKSDESTAACRLPEKPRQGGAVSGLIFISGAFMVAFSSRRGRPARILAITAWLIPVCLADPVLTAPGLALYALSPGWQARYGCHRKALSVTAAFAGFVLAAAALALSAGWLSMEGGIGLGGTGGSGAAGAGGIAGYVVLFLVSAIIQELIMGIVPGDAAGGTGSAGGRSFDAGRRDVDRREMDRRNVDRAKRRKRLFAARLDHRLFEPVSLTDSSGRIHGRAPVAPQKTPAPRRPMEILAAAAVLLVGLSAGFIGLYRDGGRMGIDSLPAPAEPLGTFDDFDAYRRLDAVRDAASLPDAAGMLASAAYQEGFLFGAGYRVPDNGGMLGMSTYSATGPGLIAGETVIEEYDAEWLDATLQRELTTGVGRLLASAGGPAPVRPVRINGGVPDESRRAVMAAVAAAFLIAFIIMLTPSRASRRDRRIHTPMQISRRRAQAA